MKPRADGSIPPHQPNCFGCGPENAAGLGLNMHVDRSRVRADLVLDHRHEGAPGFAHGGVVASALDDLFGGVLVMLGRAAVTANLTVDYRAPALLGHRLRLTGWCARNDGRKLHLRGELHDAGTLVAEARALFISVDGDHFQRSGATMPEEWDRWLTSPGAEPTPSKPDV